MRKMKAAVLYRINEPLRIEKVPVPEVGPGEVLIQIKASGICGSDLHIIDGSTKRDLPLIVGHECAGYVAELGEGVTDWSVGDRVSVNCIITCQKCRNCLEGREVVCQHKQLIGHHVPGAYAEYVKVPARNLISLPETVPFEYGAILTDAVATPFHAITKRANIQLGENIAVFGIGGLGIHAVQLAKLAGVAKIYAVDMNPTSLMRATEFGAIPINAKEVDAVQAILADLPEGVDASLEFIGSPITIDQAVRVLRMGGRAVVSGLSNKPIQTIDPGVFVRSEFSLIGAYGFNNVEIEKLISLVESNQLQLSGSVTQTITLAEANEGVIALRDKIGDPIRIVITF
jgi:propanol-preferring alcohol dehydrogenase